MTTMTTLIPGSTIGILGGGQLGRMLSIAAAQLGYRCHIYAPEADNIASEVAAKCTLAAYDDAAALAAFARSCDVITYEFENVPVAPLALIGGLAPLNPSTAALKIAQDRVSEKQFAIHHGGRTAQFAQAKTAEQLKEALTRTGRPAIAKTVRMGYDGKGQVRIGPGIDHVTVWESLGQSHVIVEAMVEFEAEFSVILVRGSDGEIRFWDSTRNAHENGILAYSSLPAGPLIESQQGSARTLAAAMAEALEYVGVMTCEFFATDNGPIFNEMAPRVHNSGHWTIEGAKTCQFENHIRAICGLPLGNTQTLSERVEMRNLIGDDVLKWRKLFVDDKAHVHFYGKKEAPAGRKIGHVTRLYP